MTTAERVAENSKNKQISASATGFTKSMPVGFDTDSILGAGDVIVMPATMPQVYRQIFGVDDNGEDIYAEFIVVDVEHEGKPTRAINFFPSSLTKNIWESKKNEDGEVERTEGGPLNPKGTAVDLYTSVQGKTGPNGETDTALGMQLLLNKKIKISDAKQIDTQVFRNGKRVNALKKTNLFTYDLV